MACEYCHEDRDGYVACIDHRGYLFFKYPNKRGGRVMSKDSARFLALRKRLFEMIKAELKIDPCCKSFEGTLEVICDYPNYFEDEEATRGPSYYCIRLHCYVLGPSRNYDFTGKTMNEALDKLEKALDEWAEEATDGEQD